MTKYSSKDSIRFVYTQSCLKTDKEKHIKKKFTEPTKRIDNLQIIMRDFHIYTITQ